MKIVHEKIILHSTNNKNRIDYTNDNYVQMYTSTIIINNIHF